LLRSCFRSSITKARNIRMYMQEHKIFMKTLETQRSAPPLIWISYLRSQNCNPLFTEPSDFAMKSTIHQRARVFIQNILWLQRERYTGEIFSFMSKRFILSCSWRGSTWRMEILNTRCFFLSKNFHLKPIDFVLLNFQEKWRYTLD
jgi:hypothetical protein